MPTSKRHEGLVLLFRNRPELAASVLRDQLGLQLPEYEKAALFVADLTTADPPGRHVDLVVVLEGPSGKLAVVVEVQLKPDYRKRWSWPEYLAGLRARLKCPVVLLVVTPEERVARWASEPIALGPGSVLTPQVLRPSRIPEVLDLKEASRSPELAVLSVMGHGGASNALELAKVALKAMGGLDDDRARTYADLVLAALSKAARRAMEALMQSGYEYQSDFAKKYVAEGRAESKAEDVLAVLRARDVKVSAAAEERISECADLKQLGQWIVLAATVSRVEELFAPGKAKKPATRRSTKKSRR